MKEMISPYRQTPSASPTKIKDLPRTLESSLIAPSAALAALATAIPPPIQERPVTSAAARYPIPVAIVAPEDVAASAACTFAGPASIMIDAMANAPKKKNALTPIVRL